MSDESKATFEVVPHEHKVIDETPAPPKVPKQKTDNAPPAEGN
jgi:hypothetical protein